VEYAKLTSQERKNLLKAEARRRKSMSARKTAAARALAALDPDAKKKHVRKFAEEKVEESALTFAPPERQSAKDQDRAKQGNLPAKNGKKKTKKEKPAPEVKPEAIQLLKSKIRSAAYNTYGGRQLEVLFSQMDKDRSGCVEYEEFRFCLRRIFRIPPEAISEAQISQLSMMLDTDNSGSINLEELVQFVGPDPVMTQQERLAPQRGKLVPQLTPEVIRLLKSKLASAAYTSHNGRQMEALFSRMDKDGSGSVDDIEFKSCMRRVLKIPPESISDEEMSALCSMLDTNRSGAVDLPELMDFVGPDPTMPVDQKPKKGKLVPELTPEAISLLKSKINSAAYTGHSGRQLEVLFSRMDKDGSGAVEDGEFLSYLRRVFQIPPQTISDAEASALCSMLDTNRSGGVDLEELMSFVGPDPKMTGDFQPPKKGKLVPELTPEVLHMVKSKIKSSSYTGDLPSGTSGRQLHVLFSRMDKDRSGYIEDDEFQSCLRRVFQIPPSAISDAQIMQLCSMLDTDKSGKVDLDELRAFVGEDPSMTPNYEEYRSVKKVIDPKTLQQLKSRIKSAAYVVNDGQQLAALFAQMDKDGSGCIDYLELQDALRRQFKMPPEKISDEEVLQVCAILDTNNSGEVELAELENFIGPEPERAESYEQFMLREAQARETGAAVKSKARLHQQKGKQASQKKAFGSSVPKTQAKGAESRQASDERKTIDRMPSTDSPAKGRDKKNDAKTRQRSQERKASTAKVSSSVETGRKSNAQAKHSASAGEEKAATALRQSKQKSASIIIPKVRLSSETGRESVAQANYLDDLPEDESSSAGEETAAMAHQQSQERKASIPKALVRSETGRKSVAQAKHSDDLPENKSASAGEEKAAMARQRSQERKASIRNTSAERGKGAIEAGADQAASTSAERGKESVLDITVFSASGLTVEGQLPARDADILPNAYCVAEVQGQAQTIVTKTVFHTSDPEWNEGGSLRLHTSDSISFTIYDKDINSENVLGVAMLEAAKVLPGGFSGDLELRSHGKIAGALKVELIEQHSEVAGNFRVAERMKRGSVEKALLPGSAKEQRPSRKASSQSVSQDERATAADGSLAEKKDLLKVNEKKAAKSTEQVSAPAKAEELPAQVQKRGSSGPRRSADRASPNS